MHRMHKTTAANGETIINQGEEGDQFYVLESGTCEILIDGVRIGQGYDRGATFGELAL